MRLHTARSFSLYPQRFLPLYPKLSWIDTDWCIKLQGSLAFPAKPAKCFWMHHKCLYPFIILLVFPCSSKRKQKKKKNFSKMTKDQLVEAQEKVYMDECELHDNELECRVACGRKYFPAFAWSLTHCKVIHERLWIKALCPLTQPPFETHIHKTGIAQWARPALLLFLPLTHPQPRAQPPVTTRLPAFDSHAMEQKG